MHGIDISQGQPYAMPMARLNWTGDVGWSYTDERGNPMGITAERVQADLEALAGQPLEVDISTYGGDFDHAARIYDMVLAYPGKKKLYLSATVASAGTLIALAFPKETTFARDFTRFMIHNAQGFAMGDHNDMREQAEHFEKMSTMVAEKYAERTGKSLEEIKTMMDDETWFFGQEIVDQGFAGGMDDYASGAELSASARMNVRSEFKARATMWATREAPEDPMIATMKASVEKLVAAGKIDKDSPWATAGTDKVIGFGPSDNTGFKYPVGKNGKVYRSALRSLAARAAKDNPELATWAEATARMIAAKGEKHVDKDQVIAWLKANPGVDIVSLAAEAGIKLSLVTEEHTAGLALRKQFADLKVSDPLAQFKANEEALKKVESDRIENKLDATFGPAKLADGKDNLVRKHAAGFFAGVKMDTIDAKIEEFKKDPIALQLAGQSADVGFQLGFREPDQNGNKKTETSYRGMTSREV